MWLVLLLYILKILGSDLGLEIRFPDRVCVVSLSHPGKCPEHASSFHSFQTYSLIIQLLCAM
jgi:hypothetical protein